jgi:hypothetical protein
MRIPNQDIQIVNNHPVNFQRRIYPKSHPRSAAVLAKIHGRKKGKRIFDKLISFLMNSDFKYHCLGSSCISRCDGCSLF